MKKQKTLTSIGIVQLPQYFTVSGYAAPSFGPIIKCGKISVIVGEQSFDTLNPNEKSRLNRNADD